MQEIIVFNNQELASDWLALAFSGLIAKNNQRQKPTVLGFATGVSPLIMYQKLITIHHGKYKINRDTFINLEKIIKKLFNWDLSLLVAKNDKNQQIVQLKPLSWKNVITFNLDEFIGLNKDHKEEFANYMNYHLFKHPDLQASNIHFPNVYTTNHQQAALEYEKIIKKHNGIDLQLITLGINGHMAYNEPGTLWNTYTHVAKLSSETRDNLIAQNKFMNLDETPTTAMTVGIQTILEMKQVIMASFGSSKAEMTKRMLQENVNSQVSASALQKHKNCVFILDQEAASKLNKDDKNYNLTFID